MVKSRKKCRWLIPFIAVITLGCLLFEAVSIYNYGRRDNKIIADTAIILGAGVTGEEPSPVFRERINHGIWLYQNNYVSTIIFTGGYSAGNDISDAAIAKRYALNKGIPAEAIYIEEISAITEENLLYAKAIMAEQRLQTAIIVSDPLHMKRAMRMAADLDLAAYSSPTPTTRYIGWKSQLQFLSREVFFYTLYRITRILPR